MQDCLKQKQNIIVNHWKNSPVFAPRVQSTERERERGRKNGKEEGKRRKGGREKGRSKKERKKMKEKEKEKKKMNMRNITASYQIFYFSRRI